MNQKQLLERIDDLEDTLADIQRLIAEALEDPDIEDAE